MAFSSQILSIAADPMVLKELSALAGTKNSHAVQPARFEDGVNLQLKNMSGELNFILQLVMFSYKDSYACQDKSCSPASFYHF